MNKLRKNQDPFSLRNLMIRRAQIMRQIRRTLDERGYVEVETPLRVRSPGTDVNLDAFESEGRYLITSPEFHMKRLLSAGFMRIYQICRCFRKGERTVLHNPEFSMLEFYAAGLDLEQMMNEIEELIWDVAENSDAAAISFAGTTCSLRPPWDRISVDEAFRRYAGWSPLERFDEEQFYFDLVDKVDRHLGIDRPAILHDYPAPLAMLSKLNPKNSRVARRFEVYVSGIEIANAFEELTDPAEQRRRFEKDLMKRAQQNKPLYPIDEELLTALTNLPPCCGIAVGLDRLLMLLLDADSIDRVIAFPDEKA